MLICENVFYSWGGGKKYQNINHLYINWLYILLIRGKNGGFYKYCPQARNFDQLIHSLYQVYIKLNPIFKMKLRATTINSQHTGH